MLSGCGMDQNQQQQITKLMVLFFFLCIDFIFVVLAKRALYYYFNYVWVCPFFSTGDVILLCRCHDDLDHVTD